MWCIIECDALIIYKLQMNPIYSIKRNIILDRVILFKTDIQLLKTTN